MGCFKAGLHWQRLAAAFLAIMAVSCHSGNWQRGNLAVPEFASQQGEYYWECEQVPTLSSIANSESSAYCSAADSAIMLTGTEYISTYGPANYVLSAEDQLVLVSPSDSHAAWAVYSISELTPHRPMEIAIDVATATSSEENTEILPLNYWVGISNYSDYTWDWHGPFMDNTGIELNGHVDASTRLVSTNDIMGLVILTYPPSSGAAAAGDEPSTAVCINRITITTLPATDSGYQPTRPHYAAINNLEILEHGLIRLNWSHIADTANPANSAQAYLVYRQALGARESVLLGQQMAPGNSFIDPLDTTENAADPIAGLEYTYWLQAVNTNGATPCDRALISVEPEIPAQTQLVITELAIQANGAQSGTGEDENLFGANDRSGTVLANQAVTLNMKQIGGYINGEEFELCSTANPPHQVDQQLFTDAFEVVANELTWSISHGDAEGFRRSNSWLIPQEGDFPFAGDPGDLVVFPDDDPESDASNPEGRLHLDLPSSFAHNYFETDQFKIHVVDPLHYDLMFDVTPDLNAPRIVEYYDSEWNTISELHSNQDMTILIGVNLNASINEISTGNIVLNLLEVREDPSITETKQGFTYMDGEFDIDHYCTLQNSNDIYLCCIISPVSVNVGNTYLFALKGDSCSSSINKPFKTITALH